MLVVTTYTENWNTSKGKSLLTRDTCPSFHEGCSRGKEQFCFHVKQILSVHFERASYSQTREIHAFGKGLLHCFFTLSRSIPNYRY